MNTYKIAIGLTKYKDKYLLGKRAPTKEFSPNKWEFITGFIEDNESAEETILRELEEETKLRGRITGSAKKYSTTDNEGKWRISPFLIETESNKFMINKKDHSELKWVSGKELNNYEDVKEEVDRFKKSGLLK